MIAITLDHAQNISNTTGKHTDTHLGTIEVENRVAGQLEKPLLSLAAKVDLDDIELLTTRPQDRITGREEEPKRV